MGLKTRLDGRSEDNKSFKIMSEEGEELAEVVLIDSSGSTLSISTKGGLYIQKPNGWNSKVKPAI